MTLFDLITITKGMLGTYNLKNFYRKTGKRVSEGLSIYVELTDIIYIEMIFIDLSEDKEIYS